MIRVLMIAYADYFFDGRVRRHAEALAERGDSIDVICVGTGDCGGFNGVNLIGLMTRRYRGASRSSYVRSYVRFLAQASWIALKRSFRQPYDVVIACTMPDSAVLSAIPTKLFGSKIILDIHDTMPELYLDKFGGRRGALGARLLMAQERICAGLADRVLAVHEPHRARLERAGIRAEKIVVVLNSPDSRIFVPHANSNRAGPEFEIAYHGTVSLRLGLDVAIEAMGLLRNRIPAAQLKIIGSGEYLSGAKSLVTRLGLHDRVSFVGRVPLQQLPEALKHTAVGLVPNRASGATQLMLPVKLLEYASLGIPVIAPRLDAIEHYFDGTAVRFFEPGNPEALAQAIEELWRNPQRRAELAQRAAQVLEPLNWRIQRLHYYRAIDDLVGQKISAVPGVRRV
jgi:glycosyltransferase involved in cell wall biosynthesis